MSYARQAAMAGAVVLSCALNVRAQEPSKDAPPTKAVSPSPDVSSKTARPPQRTGRPGLPSRTGSDATQTTTATENTGKEDQKASEKPAARDESQRHDPIAPDAHVIQFSFVTQPWENVLEWIAELAGMSLQMEVKPTGTFSYINDPKKYTLGQAMDIINAQLISKGHILLRKGNYLKVIAFKDGVPPDLIRRVKPEELDDCGDSEYVSVILPLKNVSAKTAVDEIKGFASELGGKVVPLESVNRLMITDLVANIRLMRDYLTTIESDSGFQSKTRYFQLKYASAVKVESMLRDLFGLAPKQTASNNQSNQRSNGADRAEDWRNRMRSMMDAGGGGMNPFQMQMFSPGGGGDPRGGGGFPGGGFPGGDPRGGGGDDRRGGGDGRDGRERPATSNITLAVDEPHNQIFVKAPPDMLAIAEEVIKQVDVPRPGQADKEWAPSEIQVPTVRVYRLSDGDSQSLVTALTQIFQNTPGVRFSADQSNNAVVAVATPDDQEQIAKLVEQFEHDERDSVVLSLTVLDANTVADLLSNVYSSGQTNFRGQSTPRPGQPRVIADRSHNQIMVRGSKKQIDDIRSMLAALGEPQITQVAGSDRLRVIPLNANNSQAIRQLVEQIWPRISPNNNPIRIFDLNKKSDGDSSDSSEAGRPALPGGLRRGNGVRIPAEKQDSNPRTPPRDKENTTDERPDRTSIERRSDTRFVSYTAASDAPDADEKNAGKAEGQEGTQEPATQKDGAPVVMSFGPDNLVIASDDPAALQALMNLINSVTRSSGNGTGYTVFYLKSAEATQLQLTLNELLGVSSSSFFGSSSSSTSAPLVKIVPDPRTNSLIVFGSPNEVTHIEELIRVLDRADAPSSGGLSAPRIVPVRYANATSVARVIRDVYASRITGGGGAGGFPGGQPGLPFGGGPFGSFAGNTGSTRGSRSGSGTLSVGVDEQSNSIVLSSTESLYQEVKKLVETLDLAASETQRTVQIVTVKNSTPTAVQDALNGLMGVNCAFNTGRPATDPFGRGYGGFPGTNTIGIQPFGGGGFPGGFNGGFNGGFQGGQTPFNGMIFNRGGDSGGGFNPGRSFDGGGRSFDGGRGGGFPTGNFGGGRRPQ